MKIYEVAVKRPVTTIMLILSLVFFGAISYTRTSVDMFPSVNMPIALVMTTYNAGPEEVESIVTTNIETAVSRVPKVKSIQSTSSEGTSLVVVQFQDDVDMDSAMFKMDQYISMVSPMLPDGVSDPTILAIDPTQIPVLEASISHETMNEADLYRYLQSNVLPSLESIDGVSSVSVIGATESQVEITIKQDKLTQYGFALNSLIQQIQADNLSLPGGITSKGDLNLNLKVDGRYKSISDIENITLTSQVTGAKIKLKDIATVKMTTKEDSSVFRSNGKASIALSFDKESTANIIKTSKAIKERLTEVEQQHPGFKSFITQDQSVFIEDSVKNVLDSAILGVILAVLVLLFFLKDLKTSLIVGLAMPISIVSTFTFLYMLNITINLISLGGLTFAVGMLVDNSIIVLENIFRHIEEGEDKKTASINATKEIFLPIFASTLTNIAIFLPIVFTGGMIGDWLSNLALTVTVSMICSLIVSVTVIPMFASLFITKTDKVKILDKTKGNQRYAKALDYALSKRTLTIVVTIVVTIASFGLALTAGLEMMPSMSSNSFNISVTVDHGTKLEVVDSYAKALERKIDQLDYVEDFHVNIGTNSLGMQDSSSMNITINTKKLSKTGKSSQEITDELQKITNETIPNKEVEVSNNGSMAMLGGMMSEGITFNLSGTDMEVLETQSNKIVQALSKESYVKSARHSYEEGLPYISVDIDKDKAASYGLTTATIATSIDTYQNGKVASRYSLDGSEIDIVVKTDTDSKESIENLKNMNIQTPMGNVIPLSTVATLKEEISPASISKSNKMKVVSFTVQIQDISQGEAQAKIQSLVNNIELPSGYAVDFTGATKELMDSLNQMILAIVIGIIIIYMILAAQFESFKQPLIIMISIPFSFTGGLITIAIFRQPISIPILMGMLMLVGIIVNNAILIVDTINVMRREEHIELLPAIKKSCLIRLRPMLLTTLTTILGLIPMAIGLGEGTKLLQPMAIFVSGGLLVGTILTMIVVPVLYFITERDRKKAK